jgi:hypothetical protein
MMPKKKIAEARQAVLEPDTAEELRDTNPDTAEPDNPPEEFPDKPVKVTAKKKKKDDPAPAKAEKPVSERQAFYSLDFRKLDKDLSPAEQQEWNAIYASFRAGSILTGYVTGVDSIKIGMDERVMCLVVFDYRVKVLIPYPEMWADAESEQTQGVMRRFLGAEVDYIVTKIDREGKPANFSD